MATKDIVQQGGSRRGALMLMLHDWHPDIEEFITVKGVINASEEELKKVDGIGDKKAQKIRDVIDSCFKTINAPPELELKFISEDEES